MEFIDNSISCLATKCWLSFLPVSWVCLCEVNYNSARTINCGGANIWINCFIGNAIDSDAVVINQTIFVAGNLGNPSSVDVLCHFSFNTFSKRAGGLCVGNNFYGCGCWCPHAHLGFSLCVCVTKIVAGVCVLCSKLW